MNMTCAAAKEYMAEFLPLVSDTTDDRDIVLAPPFTALSAMCGSMEGTAVCLASQNVHWEKEGAFTAEVSAEMLLELGVSYAIVGHSDHENTSVRATQKGMCPSKWACTIVCVGRMSSEKKESQNV